MHALVKIALALSFVSFIAACTATMNDVGVSATDMRMKTIGR